MADIVKKNGNEIVQWDPMRAMRDWLRWDPFREMTPFAEFSGLERFNPTFEVTENKDGYIFKADVPGVRKEDLEVTMTGNRLHISGKRESELESKQSTIYTYERQYGTFTRAFTLPEGADMDHVKSDLKDGVLTLVIPKKVEAQPKKITISSSTTKS
ncbi:MAG TPA: Hsp20/alpha crystallin family protein [Kofleriaceae bacterium]|nr:Hsp20/alpha crystallin family protein [Kofleriaceae bacterium]